MIIKPVKGEKEIDEGRKEKKQHNNTNNNNAINSFKYTQRAINVLDAIAIHAAS